MPATNYIKLDLTRIFQYTSTAISGDSLGSGYYFLTGDFNTIFTGMQP
jgi:hypothetical protein